MIGQRYIGLHWKLAALTVAVSLLACVALVLGYQGALLAGLTGLPAWYVAIGGTLLLVVVGAGFIFIFIRGQMRRLSDLADLAARIARGDLGSRVEVGGMDEMGDLEEQLNGMADQLNQAVAGLKRLAEQNRVLAEEARRGAAVEERARLARDLHDTVNQQLFVLTMKTAAARKRLAKLALEQAEPLVAELQEVEGMAREAHAQARELILQLRPTTLEQQGLGPAMAEYVRSTVQRNGWQLTDEINSELRVFGPVAENLFRIVQEALHNVQKHAQATAVTVRLQLVGEKVELFVRDNGIGFNRSEVRPTSVGLVGMAERVTGLKGMIKVKSNPGEGTELTVHLPLQVKGEEPGDPSAARR